MDEFEEIRFEGDAEKRLPEGWWRFRPYLAHGAQSRMEAIGMAGLTPEQLMSGAARTAPVDVKAVNDAMILGSTTEWSFGEVTQDVLDGIPGAYSKQVLARMDELYATPLVAAASVKSNGSQKPSRVGSRGRSRSPGS